MNACRLCGHQPISLGRVFCTGREADCHYTARIRLGMSPGIAGRWKLNDLKAGLPGTRSSRKRKTSTAPTAGGQSATTKP